MGLIKGEKQTGADKTARIPIQIVPREILKKPSWIRTQAPSGPGYSKIKRVLRERNLHSVCEEASCPNISECFSAGTATFMILGDICTRRCPYCDVAHGRPMPPDEGEPRNLAQTVSLLNLNYVVITSVDRDDLRDGGAGHFVKCIEAVRTACPDISVEILVPDFRGRLSRALDAFGSGLPDVLNHNIETVPRLYKQVRPGADYQHSLKLLGDFKSCFPDVPTKSGLMLGVGETDAEVVQVMKDLREVGVEMLTIGQYLQPSQHHLPVKRYVEPEAFHAFENLAYELGFTQAACGPMVRSSYHADQQASKLFAR